MKVRFSVIAAALAASVSLAAPAFASDNVADEKEDAANDAKWRCVVDKKCDGGESVVGEGIKAPKRRPLIDDDRSSGAPKPGITAPSTKRPVGVPKQGLGATSGSRVGQMAPGRSRTIAASSAAASAAAAVAAPEQVVGDNDLFVTFRRNSAELESGVTGDMRSLAKIVRESLAAGNKRVVQIGGYTDATGDDAFNLKLSQERAETVRKSLIELGVPGEAIQAVGYGETKLIDGYAPTHGINRRVEVVVVN